MKQFKVTIENANGNQEEIYIATNYCTKLDMSTILVGAEQNQLTFNYSTVESIEEINE